jgi:hypothetical protein
LCTLPPAPKATLSLVVFYLLAVVVTMIVLVLPLVRFARDLSAAIFA